MKALVVLSGGQDSVFCLGWAVQQYGAEDVATVTFDYGQRHSRELQAATKVAALYGVQDERVRLPEGILRSTSPLVDPDSQLELYEDHDSMAEIIGDRVELTFVPMRNALFLTLAANRLVAMGGEVLVTGVCEADNANYPDCREVFVRAQADTINAALGVDRVQIAAPLMHHSKADTVRAGLRVPGVFEAWAYSHTAYDGQYPPLGRDHATVLRAHGFEEAGLPDPLVLRAHLEGLMSLPTTRNYREVRELLAVALDEEQEADLGYLLDALGAVPYVREE